MTWQGMLRYLLVANYYLAAVLLGLAGVIKLNSHHIGDVLQFLFDNEFLSLSQLVLISRTQPVFEIVIFLYAVLGFGARYTAYFMGGVYLFFAGLLWIASDGYLFQPLDCGCFGEGDGTIAIVLIMRNCFLGGLLFCVPNDLCRYTFLRVWKKV